jgi:hypothetical protein
MLAERRHCDTQLPPKREWGKQHTNTAVWNVLCTFLPGTWRICPCTSICKFVRVQTGAEGRTNHAGHAPHLKYGDVEMQVPGPGAAPNTAVAEPVRAAGGGSTLPAGRPSAATCTGTPQSRLRLPTRASPVGSSVTMHPGAAVHGAVAVAMGYGQEVYRCVRTGASRTSSCQGRGPLRPCPAAQVSVCLCKSVLGPTATTKCNSLQCQCSPDPCRHAAV